MATIGAPGAAAGAAPANAPTAVALATAATDVADTIARLGSALSWPAGTDEATDTPQFATERRNLLNVFTIALKALLEACANRAGEAVTDDLRQLDQFCIVMENVFRHGLRGTSPRGTQGCSVPLALTQTSRPQAPQTRAGAVLRSVAQSSARFWVGGGTIGT